MALTRDPWEKLMEKLDTIKKRSTYETVEIINVDRLKEFLNINDIESGIDILCDMQDTIDCMIRAMDAYGKDIKK